MAADFFPTVDRAATRVAAPKAPAETLKGQTKKGASSSAASDFADELKSARSADRESADISSRSSRAERASSRPDRRETQARSERRAPTSPQARQQDSTRPNASRSESRESRSEIGVDREAERLEAPADAPVRPQTAVRSQVEQAELGVRVARPQTASLVGAAIVQGDETVSGEKAVLEFMSEMNARFGVSPEEIVTAFAELDPETLRGRPEDAMSEFLAALQIPPQQMAEAAALYTQMVRETGQAALNESMGTSEGGMNLQVLGAREYRKLRTMESLDAMSNRFFRDLPSESTVMMSELPINDGIAGRNSEIKTATGTGLAERLKALNADGQASATKQDTPSSAKDENVGSLGLAFGALGGLTAGAAKAAGRTAAVSGQAAETAGSIDVGSMTAASGGIDRGLGQILGEGFQTATDGGSADGDAFPQSGRETAEAGSALSGSAAAGASSFAAVAASAFSREAGESDGDLESSDAMDGSAPLSTGAAVSTGPQVPGDVKAGATATAMMGARPEMTAEEKQENVQELMRQAQVILRKGGGEMKMQLKPEGVGQVDLKVLVQDGQVKIQMVTETEEARKLLENGLSELKSQLAAQKLQVETLKVDMAGDGLKKFEQQMNGEGQREQARAFAQDFLGQFREDRQAMRGGLMDNALSRSYDRQQKRSAMQPEPVSANGAKKPQSGSRRLNLVA